MKLVLIFKLLLLLVLAGCGSVPPAPVDHFYRLQPVALVAPPVPVITGRVLVRPFRAESLYAERPVVYADSATIHQLHQYHYHLWLYPPAQLIQDHFVSSLDGVLDLHGDLATPNVLEARLVAFERINEGAAGRASVVIEFRLSAAGTLRLKKVYRAEQAFPGTSMEGFVRAMEGALGRVYRELVEDLARRP